MQVTVISGFQVGYSVQLDTSERRYQLLPELMGVSVKLPTFLSAIQNPYQGDQKVGFVSPLFSLSAVVNLIVRDSFCARTRANQCSWDRYSRTCVGLLAARTQAPSAVVGRTNRCHWTSSPLVREPRLQHPHIWDAEPVSDVAQAKVGGLAKCRLLSCWPRDGSVQNPSRSR